MNYIIAVLLGIVLWHEYMHKILRFYCEDN